MDFYSHYFGIIPTGLLYLRKWNTSSQNMEKYLLRYIERDIERKLKSSGAVVVCGPKFCGKTTTASRFAKSVLKLNTSYAIDVAQMEPRLT